MSQINAGTLNVTTTTYADSTSQTSGSISGLITGSPSNGDSVQYNGSAWVPAAVSGAPVGAIFAYAKNTPPTGFLKCNGASISTSTYSALHTVIGTTFGGSGSNFNVPDLRGEFIRGWDDGRIVDNGRNFGSTQGDMVEEHRHWISSMATDDRNITGTGGNGQEYGLVSDAGGYSANDPNKSTGRYTRNDPSGNGETRPRNLALMYIIKY